MNTTPAPTAPRVVVEFRDGIVTGVYTSIAMSVVVLDFDTDGLEPERLVAIPIMGTSASRNALASLDDSEVMPQRVDQVFAHVQRDGTDQTSMMHRELTALGFEREPGGAGLVALTFYRNGWRVTVTDQDGGDVPSFDSWAIGVYDTGREEREAGYNPELDFSSDGGIWAPALAACLLQIETPTGDDSHPLAAVREEARTGRENAKASLAMSSRTLDDLRARLGKEVGHAETGTYGEFCVQALLDTLEIMAAHQYALATLYSLNQE